MQPLLLAEKILRHAVSIPSELAFRLKSKRIDCCTAETDLPSFQPSLDKFAEEAVKSIQKSGYFVCSLDDFETGPSRRMFQSGRTIFSRLENRSFSSKFRHFHTITAKRSDLEEAEPIFYWGLNDKLLQIASQYLGSPPAYDAFSTYYSRADGRQAGPRLWHRDKEDKRMLKVAVYFSDVDEASGPYQIIKPKFNKIISRDVFRAMTDSEIRSILRIEEDESFYNSCIGRAGTVIFSDTATYYHRGCPPLTRNRSAIFFSYFTNTPSHPYFCERSPYSRMQLVNLAKDLQPEKRDHVLWRAKLPLRFKLVPRNRVKV